jgi:RNA polymerase sigma-70 factor (ECF subfamily)
MFRILINPAMTRGEREKRTQPFSSLTPSEAELVVDPVRFAGGNHLDGGMWRARRGTTSPRSALDSQLRALLRSVIEALPPNRRSCLSLRDAEDMSSTEVCELLGVREGNQRVFLHRARANCRNVLERVRTEASRSASQFHWNWRSAAKPASKSSAVYTTRRTDTLRWAVGRDVGAIDGHDRCL